MAYHRPDIVGKCTRKLLYQPRQSERRIKSNNRLAKNLYIDYTDSDTDFTRDDTMLHASSTSTSMKPRLSLRHLASYKFLLYFFLSLLCVKAVSGYSFFVSFLMVSLLFLMHFLCTN